MAGLSAHEELIRLRKRARRRLVGAIVMVIVTGSILWQVVSHVPDQQIKPETVEFMADAADERAKVPYAKHQASAVPLQRQAQAVPGQEASAPQQQANAPQPSTDLPASLAMMGSEPLPESLVPPPPPAPSPQPIVPPSTPPNALPSGQDILLPQPQVDAPTEKRVEKKRPKVDPAAILEGRIDGETALLATNKSEEAPKPSTKVYIQLAALSDQSAVDALHDKLDNLGLSARFTEVQTNKGKLTRIRVGPFAAREEAEVVLKKLARIGVSGGVIIKK